MQCPHYGGCPYFRGVFKLEFRCSIIGRDIVKVGM